MNAHLDTCLGRLSAANLQRLLLDVARVDELRGWLAGRDKGGQTSDAVRVRVAEVSAAAAVRLAEAMGSDRQRPVGAAEKDRYRDALLDIFANGQGMRLGEGVVRELHARISPGAAGESSGGGGYRTVAEGVAPTDRGRPELFVRRATPPHLVAAEVKAACEWLQARLRAEDTHPLLLVGGFILEFLTIRPFADGNMRMSRLLSNLLLLQSGYTHVSQASLDEVVAERWPDYYLALRQSQARRHLPQRDIGPWLTAFVESVRLQAERAVATVPDPAQERLLSTNQAAVLALLDGRELVTNQLIRRQLGLPRETAKQTVNRLVALGLVERVGAGRATRYRRAAPRGK
jgi:Fic family protein